ncbi:MAG: aspartate aminotransferase family protein [Phycisphaeraceae bacterium]|nr:aspartate aminotransferase family protein [Phycisphaeraceae bacterium]
MAQPFNLKSLLDATEGRSLELIDQHINPVFAKVLRTIGFDVQYVRGQGPYLWDSEGNRYIDCLGGYAVFNVGRNHPVVRSAIQQAMEADLPNLIKMGAYRLSGLLAGELVKIAPPGLDTVFFTNCGTEGVETAIKYARAATGRRRMVYCKRGFHGLTTGSLSLNGGQEFREGFGDLLPDTTMIPFNDAAALEAELLKGDVAGFIVEPIQGKGVTIADADYLPAVADLCRKHGALFILDEVQTGYGRTGRMFAAEHWDVEPDVMITAKGLSGGYVPVGAVLCRRWIFRKVFSTLDRCVVHSTTFGQNDLAMAAGLATLHVLREERIVENAATMGQRLIDGLNAMAGEYEMVKEARGKGLMVALEFQKPRSLGLGMGWKLLHKLDESLFCQAVLMPLFTDHHILAQVAGHHMDIIKLIPPMVVSAEDVDQIVTAFDKVVAACHKFPGPAWEVGKKLGAAALRKRAPTTDQPVTTG